MQLHLRLQGTAVKLMLTELYYPAVCSLPSNQFWRTANMGSKKTNSCIEPDTVRAVIYLQLNYPLQLAI